MTTKRRHQRTRQTPERGSRWLGDDGRVWIVRELRDRELGSTVVWCQFVPEGEQPADRHWTTTTNVVRDFDELTADERRT